jgi:hypothetical protein
VREDRTIASKNLLLPLRLGVSLTNPIGAPYNVIHEK